VWAELPFRRPVVLLDDSSRILVQREDFDLLLLRVRQHVVILNVGMEIGDQLSDEAERKDFRVNVLPKPAQRSLLEYVAFARAWAGDNQDLLCRMLGNCASISVAKFLALRLRERIEYQSEFGKFAFVEGFAILVDEMSRSQDCSRISKSQRRPA
jgi:hypothetical protein